MAGKLNYYWDEAKYYALKVKRTLQGKALHVGLRTAMGGGAAAVATDLAYPVREAMNLAQPAVAGATQTALTTGEIIMSSTGGLLSIGVGAAVDGYLNHIGHKQSQKRLCELYRPQIAALTGKEPHQVGVADLKSVAETNPSLQDELTRNDRSRNVKNMASVIGTVAAFTAVFAAITLFPPLGALAATAATTGILSGAGLGFAAIAGGIGYTSLQVARKTTAAIGKKLLGLDAPSVEDKISRLSKQHRRDVAIVPEQVMDVFVSAQPELAQEIRESYGRDYGSLSIEQKRAVTAHYAEALQTPQIATAINAGEMNVRELTFRVHGQFSGVYPEEPFKEKVKALAEEKLDPLQHKIDGAVEKVQQWREAREQSKLQDDVAKAIEEGKPLPDKAQEVGNESYWRRLIDGRRETEKSADGQARA